MPHHFYSPQPAAPVNGQANRRRRRASATVLTGLSALTLGAAFVPRAQAQGASDAWSTNPPSGNFSGINWTTGTTTPGAPTGTIAAGDSLFFGTSSTTALNNDEAAGFSIGSFTFNAGASAYTITGNSFALGTGGITNNSTSLETINDAFTLAAPSTFTTTAGGGNLALGGVISGAGGMTFNGTGATTLSAVNTFTGGTTVNGGTLTLGAGGGAGAVRGVLTVNTGATLTLGVNNALGYTAGTQVTTLNVNGGTVNVSGNNGDEGFITSFNLTGGTMAYATTNGSAFQIAAGDASAPSITSNASSITSVISGGVNIRSGNLPINVASGTTASGVDLLISGPLTGNLPFTKNGTGVLALSGVNSYSSATVNAGTLEGTTSSLKGNITNNSALVFDQTLPATALALGTYSGVISGTGTLAKNNAGSVILSGANTYSGTTAVNGGALYVNGSLNTASAITVASGARLGGTGTVGAATILAGGAVEGGQGNAGTLTLGGLTFNGNATAFFGNLSNYTATPAISTGALTANGGAGSVALTISGTVPGAGTYQLIKYTGSIGGAGNAAFTLATPLPNRATGALDFTHPGLVDLTVTGSDFLIWAGTATNTWNTTDANWKLNSNGNTTTYIDNPGDSVVFNDAAGAAHSIVSLSAGDVHPTSVTFSNSAIDYVLQGANAIAGSTGLTKNGTGLLTINNTNTYTGTTALNAGTIALGSAGALGTTGPIVMGGGTLRYTINNATDYSARFSTAANQAYNIDTNGQAVTFATALTSAGGSLTKFGTGTLTLSALETYTGGTTVNGGTLVLNTSSGTGAVQGAITVNTGATLNLARGDALGYTAGSQVTAVNVNGGTITSIAGNNEGFLTSYNLTGGTVAAGSLFRFNVGAATPPTISSLASGTTSTFAANIDDFGAATNSLGINVAAGTVPAGGPDLLISGIIQGGGGLTKTGNGFLNLTGQNTFTGPVSINSGTVNIGAVAANNGSTGALGNASAPGRTITVGAGATLSGTVNNWFGNNGNADANLPAITVNGGTLSTTRYTTVGALNLNGATVTAASTEGNSASYQAFAFRGNVTVGGTAPSTITSTNVATNQGGYHLGANTTFTVAATGAAGADLTVSAPLVNQSGDFGNAAGGLTKAGAGTMLLTATSTYTGATVVNAGSLFVSGTGSIGSGSAVTVNNAGTVLGGTGVVNGAVTIGNGAILRAGNTALATPLAGPFATGPLTLATGSTFDALLTSSGISTLNASGTTILDNAAFSISLTPGTTFTNGQILTLITSNVSGQFTNGSYVAGGYVFTADYLDDPGFDVRVTAVPEPNAGLVLAGIAGVAIACRRRLVIRRLGAVRG